MRLSASASATDVTLWAISFNGACLSLQELGKFVVMPAARSYEESFLYLLSPTKYADTVLYHDLNLHAVIKKEFCAPFAVNVSSQPPFPS
jgi:hypothetical protein